MKKDRDHSKSRKTKAIENTSPFMRLLFSAIKSVAIAFLAALAFIFAGCLVGYSLKDPAACARSISLSALYVSFFICGFASSKLQRGNPILTGLFSATLYLLPILAVSLLIKPTAHESLSFGNRVATALATIPCSVVGAFFGNIRIAQKRNSVGRRTRR